MTTLDARQLGLAGNGSPESPAAINTFNRAVSGPAVVAFPPGLYLLPAPLWASPNVLYRGPGATLQALSPDTPIFLGDSITNTAWEDLRLVGLGSDYANRNSGGPAAACGIKLTGRGLNSSVRISGCRFLGFAWAGIFATNISDLLVEETLLAGPGPSVIPAGGNGCFGLAVYSPYTKIRVRSGRFTGTASALLLAQQGSDVVVDDSDFYDIPGQHGVYAAHARGLSVTNSRFKGIHYDAVKVQHDTLGGVIEDGQDITITDNSFQDVRGKPVVVANLNPPGTHDFRGLTITDNVMHQLGQPDDGIYLRGCHQAQVANNTILGGQHGVRLSASTGVQVTDNTLSRQGQCGVAAGLPLPAAAQDTSDVQILRNDILNPAQAHKPGYTFHIGLWAAAQTTIDGNTFLDSAGNTTRPIQLTPRADAATIHIGTNHVLKDS